MVIFHCYVSSPEGIWSVGGCRGMPSLLSCGRLDTVTVARTCTDTTWLQFWKMIPNSVDCRAAQPPTFRLGVCTPWPADAAIAIRPWRREAFRERYGTGSDDFQQFGRHHAATWPGMLVHCLEMSNWEEGLRRVAEGVGVSQQKQNVGMDIKWSIGPLCV